jgi:hypothetical protein
LERKALQLEVSNKNVSYTAGNGSKEHQHPRLYQVCFFMAAYIRSLNFIIILYGGTVTIVPAVFVSATYDSAAVSGRLGDIGWPITPTDACFAM